MAAKNRYQEFDPEHPDPSVNTAENSQNPSGGGIFSIDSYKVYFEVDKDIVLARLMKTLWPFNRSKFFENKADLYGAVWVPTTLVILLSVAGAFGQNIGNTEEYVYNPAAILEVAFVIYFFVFSVPAALVYILLTGSTITYSELLSIYGYSYFIFCPAAIISIIDFTALRWAAFGAASFWAATLLVKNFYSEMDIDQVWKKYLTIAVSCSGYVALTMTANTYLFNQD